MFGFRGVGMVRVLLGRQLIEIAEGLALIRELGHVLVSSALVARVRRTAEVEAALGG